MGKVSRKEIILSEPIKLRSRTAIGGMYMFFYDPKHKATLPYYDRFPLTIVVGPAEGGFYGLNMHYLPLPLRAKFLDALMGMTTNKKYDDNTKFALTYEMLQSTAKLKYFAPCYKRYLNTHLRSKPALVPAPEWEIATFLPTADWAKKSQAAVYKDSRSKI